MHKCLWEDEEQFVFDLISFTKPYAAQISAMLVSILFAS